MRKLIETFAIRLGSVFLIRFGISEMFESKLHALAWLCRCRTHPNKVRVENDGHCGFEFGLVLVQRKIDT